MQGKIIITGAGGYIGSHAARHFLELGYSVLAFDNFSTGFRQGLEILQKKYKRLVIQKGDIRQEAQVRAALKKYQPELVVHLAARCLVDESMRDPHSYFLNNTFGTAVLLEAMRLEKISKLIFSSTCAVYGEVQSLPVTETDPLNPTNPYGESKRMCESEIAWYGKAYGIDSVILRFFNVCGASEDGVIGDSKKPSVLLVQNAVRGAMKLEPFYLTCPKVSTPDGTPIRDYIDVEDLARAIELSFTYLRTHKNSTTTINLGSGSGQSVREIVGHVESIFHTKIPIRKGRTRKGEYAKLYTATKRATALLKFKPKKTLRESILSLKKWYENRPHGYTH